MSAIEFTFASYELSAKRGSTSTSSLLTRRNGVFGADCELLLNDELFLPFLMVNDESLFSENFRFLPLLPFSVIDVLSSPFSFSSLAKPPDTNVTGLKFGVLVIDGFNLCTVAMDLLALSSLSSLSSLLESDDSFLAAPGAGFALLLANLGFLAAVSLSLESLLSSDDDSAFRFAAPFVIAGLTGA